MTFTPKLAQDLDDFVRARHADGDYLSLRLTLGGNDYALILTRAPVQVPDGIQGLSFRGLRAGDNDGTLSVIWNRLDAGPY